MINYENLWDSLNNVGGSIDRGYQYSPEMTCLITGKSITSTAENKACA
jgi:hypothetical protein